MRTSVPHVTQNIVCSLLVNGSYPLICISMQLESTAGNRKPICRDIAGMAQSRIIIASPRARLLRGPRTPPAARSIDLMGSGAAAASFAPAVSCLSQVCQEVIVQGMPSLKAPLLPQPALKNECNQQGNLLLVLQTEDKYRRLILTSSDKTTPFSAYFDVIAYRDAR